MKFFKGFLILLISFIGGFSAFYVMNRYRSEDSVHVSLKSTYLEEEEKSTHRYEKIRDEVNFGGNFPDLRGASRKAVAGVVHIKSVAFTKAYVGNPLLDFIFGNEPQLRKVPKSMEIGSGVIISSDGYIVTNNHVVGENNEASVVLNDKREFSARIVGRDPATDLALLKINAENLEYLEYGDSDNVSIGEWVLAAHVLGYLDRSSVNDFGTHSTGWDYQMYKVYFVQAGGQYFPTLYSWTTAELDNDYVAWAANTEAGFQFGSTGKWATMFIRPFIHF